MACFTLTERQRTLLGVALSIGIGNLGGCEIAHGVPVTTEDLDLLAALNEEIEAGTASIEVTVAPVFAALLDESLGKPSSVTVDRWLEG